MLAQFLDADGALHTIPTKRRKQLVVLDHVAQAFELGVVYPEVDVNAVLRRFHPDVAALRRYLVDDGFLTREANQYWRSGGTVALDEGRGPGPGPASDVMRSGAPDDRSA
ncbi:hypothetical protein GCM10027215_27940 [Nocardioides zeae]